MSEKAARYIGNLNAAKDPQKLRDARLNTRANSGDMAEWRKQAAAAGVTLADWVNQTLNEKAKKG